MVLHSKQKTPPRSFIEDVQSLKPTQCLCELAECMILMFFKLLSSQCFYHTRRCPKNWPPFSGADLVGGRRGCAPSSKTPPPRNDLRFSNTTGILQKKKKKIWFIGVEVEQETSAPPPNYSFKSSTVGSQTMQPFSCCIIEQITLETSKKCINNFVFCSFLSSKDDVRCHATPLLVFSHFLPVCCNWFY